MEIQGSLEKAFATLLRTLGRRRCGVHSFGHPCVQNDTTHITLESGFKSLHFKIVCLDTAQEILRKHEKTTYSVGLSPVTPAHTCRGPSKDKTRELCRCRFESKTGCFWLFTSSFCLWQSPTKKNQFIEKTHKFPIFFHFYHNLPGKKKGDVITLRSFWTSHLALRGPRGLRGLRPAHFQQAAPPADVFQLGMEIFSWSMVKSCQIQLKFVTYPILYPWNPLILFPWFSHWRKNSLTTHPVTGNISRSCDSRCSGASKNSWNSC